MGILDDAIRQHLELKRQHGADDGDLERLEKEAFGPSTRPGDPEFDTSEGQVVADPEASGDATDAPEAPSAGTDATEAPSPGVDAPEVAAEAADAEPSTDTGTTAPDAEPPSAGGIFDAESDSGDEDWLSTLEDVVESPPAEEQPAVEQPQAPAVEEPTAETPAPAAPDADEQPDLGLPSTRPDEDVEEGVTPAEQARLEHADLGDTVAHDAIPEPTAETPAAPPEAPESAIFDHDSGEDFDLDLDLDDEEPEASAGPGPATDERPVEPDPTSTEMDALPPAPAPSTDDFEIDDEEEDELEDDDEDLLEETPDFLQDAPEGERLWFEQGAPKDFDFEDDDD